MDPGVPGVESQTHGRAAPSIRKIPRKTAFFAKIVSFFAPQGAQKAILSVKSDRLLGYPNETEYRYLVATDLSWRTLDIVQRYTLRWLVEVFLEDWTLNEGWVHPEQQARLSHQAPACTLRSLRQRCQGEALVDMLLFPSLIRKPPPRFPATHPPVK